MGPGQKFLTRVGSDQIFVAQVGSDQIFVAQVGSGWVSHLWFGYGFGKFPLKMSNISIFSPLGKKNVIRSGQKVLGSEPGRPLIYCGSKVCPGRVRTHLCNYTAYSV